MADRTSAGIFADLFIFLAKTPDTRNKTAALYVWNLSRCYDFHPIQMGIPETLESLGLAEKDPDPDPDEEGCWIFGPLGERRR